MATDICLTQFSDYQIQIAALLFSPETYVVLGEIRPDDAPLTKLANFLANDFGGPQWSSPLFVPIFYNKKC